VTLPDTEWEEPPATPVTAAPVDQDLLLAAAKRRLKARLDKAADAQITALLDGTELTDNQVVPGMADAVTAALADLEAEQLEQTAAVAGDTLEAAARGDGPDGEPQLYFEKMPDWVDQFLCQAYRREISPKSTWCSEYWKHPEAALRLSAMWRAWEALRLEPGTGMSVWWRDHADHHMPRLLDANGPFKGCTLAGHGVNAKLEPLPFAKPPAELYDPLTYTV
jgi:hypothetical protein